LTPAHVGYSSSGNERAGTLAKEGTENGPLLDFTSINFDYILQAKDNLLREPGNEGKIQVKWVVLHFLCDQTSH
jgi:hypothetical protein